MQNGVAIFLLTGVTVAGVVEYRKEKKKLLAEQAAFNSSQSGLAAETDKYNQSQAALSAETAKYNQSQQSLSQVSAALAAETTKYNQTQAALDAQTQRLSQTQVQLQQAQAQYNSEVQQYNQLQSQLQGVQNSLNGLQGQYNAAQSQIQSANGSINDLRNSVQLQKDMAAALQDPNTQSYVNYTVPWYLNWGNIANNGFNINGWNAKNYAFGALSVIQTRFPSYSYGLYKQNNSENYWVATPGRAQQLRQQGWNINLVY